MINRILNLPEQVIDGVTLPVVPGAYRIDPQGEGWYTARGPEEKAPATALNATCHPTIAYLHEDAPGRFVVFAEKEVLDKIGQGPSLADYTGDWAHYRVDGDEPDTDPDAKPGARVVVANRAVKLEANPPTDVSELNPLTIGAVKVTAIKKSIPSTMGPTNLITLAEKTAG